MNTSTVGATPGGDILSPRSEPKIELPPILLAACDLFCVNGYHGTSIRSIAQRASISVPGVYYHYRSKQEILEKLVNLSISELLRATRNADLASDGTAIGRLNAVVGSLMEFHILFRKEAFVASTEMRSMEPDVLSKHIAKRDKQQELIREIIVQGISEGAFRCIYDREIARAIASLCVAMSNWYHPGGPLGPQEVVDRHLKIVHRMVGYSNNT